ncbi:DEKNAAC100826 [Brettanomyces naardenensis]|uniref:DEKNAAC100826 n=1 Tax=Brettanomyces naardenensis TaxID=13370 RepID=A0A448YF94_BRENA|nr:DEKNAAC100826 [Brettanomyces naardenensis]
MSTIWKALKSERPLLLDGATGTELEKRGVDVSDRLWSGRAVMSDPEKLEEVYMDYLESGSDLIETATYQLSGKGLSALNIDPRETYQKSIEIAHKAQERYLKKTGKKTFIVGSIGPYGAYLADGSEYTGHYGEVDDQTLRAFHKDRLEYMYSSPLVDIIGFETIPTLDEVDVILDMMKEIAKTVHGEPKPFYIALSCNDEFALADGTSLHKALEHIDANLDDNLVAVGTNCCRLRTSMVLVEKFDLEFNNFPKLDKQCKIIIYPNSGEIFDVRIKSWKTDEALGITDLEEAFKIAAGKFLAKKRLGFVGGCCRTGPEHIKLLRKMIDEKAIE